MIKIYYSLFFVLLSFSAVAQKFKVSGKVTDARSGGIPGITVTVKGSTKGTNTDVDGNYQISVPAILH